MNSDIRIKVSFKGHRKRHHLERLLGSIGATRYLVDLWLTAAQQRPDGDLKDWNEKDIAMAAAYKGKPQKFVDSLLESGFLDRDGEGYSLHDWEEHQPWCCGAPRRSDQARRAAEERWGHGRQGSEDTRTTPCRHPEKGSPTLVDSPSVPTSECKDDAHSINEHMPLSVSSPSPNHIPSLPIPIPTPAPTPELAALFSQLPPSIRNYLKGHDVELESGALRELLSYCKELPLEDILYALKEGIKHDAQTWSYVAKILERKFIVTEGRSK